MPSRPSASKLYLLRVELVGICPAIWRELLVPSATTLDRLHEAIQAAFPWTNSHTHAFRVGRAILTDPAAPDAPRADEGRFTLADVLPRMGARIEYEYDSADGWLHGIRVEEVLVPRHSASRPSLRCVGGARACPPEDCGGPLGYEELLLALAHPNHVRHEELSAWLEVRRAELAPHDSRYRGPFDPESFDPRVANQAVARATRGRGR